MFNREKRAIARDLVKKFDAGEISNDDFDDDFPRDRNDAALGAIYERLWFLWYDHRTHWLTGAHSLREEDQALFERCVAFLGSDLEYEWSPFIQASLSLILLRAFRFHGKAKEIEERKLKELEQVGDLGAWPFLRHEDYGRFVSRSQASPPRGSYGLTKR
jgi:hypothetical protein